MKLKTLLSSIGSTEPSDFNELCNALGPERPEKDDKRAWYILFELVRRAEEEDLVEVDRDGKKINTIILTEAGVARLTELNKERS